MTKKVGARDDETLNQVQGDEEVGARDDVVRDDEKWKVRCEVYSSPRMIFRTNVSHSME